MPEILIINTLHHLSLSLEVCCACAWKKTTWTSFCLFLFHQQLVWLFHPSRYFVRVVLHRCAFSPLRVSICSAAENARNPRVVQRDQLQPERLSRLLLQTGRGECLTACQQPFSQVFIYYAIDYQNFTVHGLQQNSGYCAISLKWLNSTVCPYIRDRFDRSAETDLFSSGGWERKYFSLWSERNCLFQRCRLEIL